MEPEIIFYAGIATIVCGIVFALICLIVMLIRKSKLEIQLNQEYGKQRD